MADYDFATVDVFTGLRFGGNPLAVFPHARGLTDDQMLSIAQENELFRNCICNASPRP